MLARCDGSARFLFGMWPSRLRLNACSLLLLLLLSGKSSVLCGLYGPTEVKLRDELLDRMSIDVHLVPNIGLSCMYA